MLILDGTTDGLTDDGCWAWHQTAPDLTRLPDTAEPADGFGYSLGVGDFNATADTDENDQWWHQSSTDVADAIERHDHFGGGRVSP